MVGQDNLRLVVLREHDKPNAANIGLIDLTVRYALDHGSCGEAEMATWYRDLDLLPGGTERIVSAETSLDDTVQLIMGEIGFATQSATQHHVTDTAHRVSDRSYDASGLRGRQAVLPPVTAALR